MTLKQIDDTQYDLSTMVKVSDSSGDRAFEGDEKHSFESGVEKSVEKQLKMIATAMSLKEEEKEENRKLSLTCRSPFTIFVEDRIRL